jgi:YggT family protein
VTLLAISRADVADYVGTLILVYTILMILWVILSWIPRLPYNPVLSAFVGFVNDVVNPYVGLFRRFIPPLKMGPGALDLSPIAAFLVLYIVGGLVVRAIQG